MQLTPELKQSFFRDGYLILRDIVPQERYLEANRVILGQTAAAMNESRELARKLQFDDSITIEDIKGKWLKAQKPMLRTGTHRAILDLVAEEDELYQVLVSLLGDKPFELRGAQLASVYPSVPDQRINEAGYPNEMVPYFNWHGHLDGLWNGARPVHQRTDRKMTKEEFEAFSGEQGNNGVRKTYPKANCNVVNFTALLGIPLTDQSTTGCGNLGLLRGAHKHVAKFFRHQRDQNSVLGPDGIDWPRLNTEAPNGAGLRHYPDYVRNQYKGSGTYTEDGQLCLSQISSKSSQAMQ